MTKQNFGRLFSPDPNDLKYLMRRLLGPVGAPMPTRKTWAIKPTALDQGNTGTCVGHAWANFLRAAPIQSNAGTDQTRWKIYDAAVLIDEWTDNDIDPGRQFGTSVRAGAKVLTNMERMSSYLWAFTLQPAVEWVLTQGPIVLGTNWYSSMSRPDAQGVVKITPSASIVGGHAYLWRGIDVSKALALCSNSWGDEWGKSGDFYIPLMDLERLILEDGEAATAVEKRLKAAK